MRNGYFDRDGQPIPDLMAWAAKMEDKSYKVVQQDRRDDFMVSTVWLGRNHRWDNGPPLIFETMVFGGKHDQAQFRYCTEAAARAGHALILSACERGDDTLPEPDA